MPTRKDKNSFKEEDQIKNFKYAYDDIELKPSTINKNRAKRLSRALKKNNVEQIIKYMD